MPHTKLFTPLVFCAALATFHSCSAPEESSTASANGKSSTSEETVTITLNNVWDADNWHKKDKGLYQLVTQDGRPLALDEVIALRIVDVKFIENTDQDADSVTSPASAPKSVAISLQLAIAASETPSTNQVERTLPKIESSAANLPAAQQAFEQRARQPFPLTDVKGNLYASYRLATSPSSSLPGKLEVTLAITPRHAKKAELAPQNEVRLIDACQAYDNNAILCSMQDCLSKHLGAVGTSVTPEAAQAALDGCYDQPPTSIVNLVYAGDSLKQCTSVEPISLCSCAYNKARASADRKPVEVISACLKESMVWAPRFERFFE